LPIPGLSIGKQLGAGFASFNVKQAEVAEMIGIGQSHISAIERGVKEPGALVLYRIGKIYGKTVEWLLTGNDE